MTAWTVVVPIKDLARAKSRLGSVPEISRAIALDTVAAIARCNRVGRIIVVTDEKSLHDELTALSPTIEVFDDPETPQHLNTDGTEPALNNAILRGASRASGPTAAVLADLPALIETELDDLLERAEQTPRGLVADQEGLGTTILTALDARDLDPRFGSESFARHQETEAMVLPAGATLRRDVDTAQHLYAVQDWPSLGPRTRAATSGWYSTPVAPKRDPKRYRPDLNVSST